MTLLLLTLPPATLITWLTVPATSDILRVPEDYPTIQAAVNAARSGDTIQVAADTYFENVVVNKTVTIVGEDAATTIVDGGSNNIVFDIQEDNVELRELTIRNGGRRYNGITIYYPYGGAVIENNRIINNVVGVLISESAGNTVDNNVLIDNSMYGISLREYSASNTIRNNQISESAYGIEASDTSNSQIVNNTISGTSYGIYVPYSNNNNISANTLSGNSWNIYLTYSNSNTIENNAVSGGSVGIQIMRSQGNSIANNTESSSSYGIYLGYCGANTVSGNTASLNDWGIELYGTDGATIKENAVSDNTWGIYIAEDSDGNSIYHNDFMNNVKQAFQDLTSSNTWRTSTTPYEGNYWSDYKGTDTNGDGIGDTYLPWAGVDWYPLIEPWGLYSDVAVVNVTVSETKVYVGQVVNITVVVENQGTGIETFSVTATYENTTLAIFGTVGTQQVVDLAPDENVTLIFSWSTTDVQPCVYYTIKAEASLVPGEFDTADNTYVDGRVKVKIMGDVNGDGVVDVWDLTIVSQAYGTFEGEPEYNPDADINKDGIVDMMDLSVVAINIGNSC